MLLLPPSARVRRQAVESFPGLFPGQKTPFLLALLRSCSMSAEVQLLLSGPGTCHLQRDSSVQGIMQQPEL